MVKNSEPITLLGLDVGDKRIGVARAHSVAKFPEPLTIVANNEYALNAVLDLVQKYEAKLVVVGLPLNLQGSETEQSEKTRKFASALKDATQIPVVFVDESLTSVMADASPSHKSATLKSNDADAACYILDRYFLEGEVLYV